MSFGNYDSKKILQPFMMSRYLIKTLTLVAGVTIVILTSCFIYKSFWEKEEKIAFINNQQLFDSFSFKKELEKEYQIIERTKLKELDSLKAQLQSMVLDLKSQAKKNIDRKEIEKYQSFQEYVFQKEEEVTAQSQAIVRDYDMKIWKRLNQFVADFAKEQNYDLLLGSKGDGNIMYAKEYYDATDEVIAYVNNRYLGKK